MIVKRWQLIIGALAIFAASFACRFPPGYDATGTPVPTVTQTEQEKPEPIETPVPERISLRETVSALQALNVRQGASERSASLGTLLHGARVSLTGECAPGWAQIRYKSGLAWVKARFITGSLCEEAG